MRLIVTTALLTGCASMELPPEFTSLEVRESPRKPSPEILGVMAKHQIEHPYKIIGIITLKAKEHENPRWIVEKIQDITKQVGGEALINLEVISPSLRSTQAFEGWDYYRADVIVFESLSESLVE